MTFQEHERLRISIEGLITKIKKYHGRSIGEQNTKASLIEPLIDALGWDTRDLDEVHREYKAKSADKPVDYALQMLRKPRLFIEAKGLGENLSDRKWVSQILGYATVAGVTWCVLTDGDEYRFYNANAPVDADDKLFCKVRLSESTIDEVCKTLNLISRGNLEGDLLDSFWKSHFVDRRVKEILVNLIRNTDKAFVRLVRKHRPELTLKEIADSICRMDFQIESPPAWNVSRKSNPKLGDSRSQNLKPNKSTHKKQKPKKGFKVSLKQLIDAKIIEAPVYLFRKYKGQLFEATLNSDGSVEFRGELFESCSSAAESARSVITGRRMATNGCSFWQFNDAKNKKRTLFQARENYISKQDAN